MTCILFDHNLVKKERQNLLFFNKYCLIIKNYFRERAARWVPADNPEPGDEGCREGEERGAGLRRHGGTQTRHLLGQGHRPHIRGGQYNYIYFMVQ